MISSPGQELALSSFQRALLHDSPASSGRDFVFVWRALLVATALLFLAVSFPVQSSVDPALSDKSVVEALNQDRLKYGLAPLEESQELKEAALAKARDIMSMGYFAHTSPSGREAWDFIRDQGFRYAFAGENLAINYTNSLELQKDFMASPSHRKNLLSPLFSEIGVAVVRGEYQGQSAVITVQIFAAPAGQPLAAK